VMSGDGIVEKLHTMKQRMEVLFSASFKGEQGEAESPVAVVDLEPWEPPIDLWESEGSWLLTADLPGLADQDLHVELAERQLTLGGSRKTTPASGAMKAVHRERPSGSFSRTFTLPGDAQADSVEAELKNGVLTVTVSRGSGPSVTSQKVKVRAG
jgi:HSP20 family molecular chaperone IbpA